MRPRCFLISKVMIPRIISVSKVLFRIGVMMTVGKIHPTFTSLEYRTVLGDEQVYVRET
jgi:hypothetical protein